MKTTKQLRNKKLIAAAAVMLALLMLGIGMLPVGASDIMPIYDHCASCDMDFYVVNSKAYIQVDYSGVPETFERVEISVEIQKKNWFILWQTVDIGEINDVWVYTSTDVEDIVNKSFSVSGKGDYRAEIHVLFYGDNNVVDHITDTIEYTYS